MKPSKKSPAMESALVDLFGFSRRESIFNNECAPTPIGCGKRIVSFDNYTETEKAEYQISALCRECQQEVFGGSDDC